MYYFDTGLFSLLMQLMLVGVLNALYDSINSVLKYVDLFDANYAPDVF